MLCQVHGSRWVQTAPTDWTKSAERSSAAFGHTNAIWKNANAKNSLARWATHSSLGQHNMLEPDGDRKRNYKGVIKYCVYHRSCTQPDIDRHATETQLGLKWQRKKAGYLQQPGLECETRITVLRIGLELGTSGSRAQRSDYSTTLPLQWGANFASRILFLSQSVLADFQHWKKKKLPDLRLVAFPAQVTRLALPVCVLMPQYDDWYEIIFSGRGLLLPWVIVLTGRIFRLAFRASDKTGVMLIGLVTEMMMEFLEWCHASVSIRRSLIHRGTD